jgi:ABC-2 type transport system permease protein
MLIQIAKAELRNLFYSPVAWFLAIAFLVQCALFYMKGMVPMAKGNDVMNEMYPGMNVYEDFPLTGSFFLQPGGMFQVALQNLYLFIPLLTMGMISREVNNGTIKLLFSSPVKLRQLVLGKYLALMVYNLLLVGIIGIFMITAFFHIKSPDYGLLLSAALGFYLLICAYGAIGLFMSSLTTYQILSAIGTFIVIFILSRIGTLWQEIPFVRDLTYFLYLSGRTGRMLNGLIASKDIIYFLMVIGMFLGFTLVRLRNAREKKPWYIKAMRNVLVIAVTVLTGYICSFPQTTLYFDPTDRENNTLHINTRQLVKEIGNDDLEVTLYTNLLGNEMSYGLPGARNAYLTNMWERFLRFKPNIRFKYVYYYYYDPSLDMGQKATLFPGKSNEEMARDIAKLYRLDLKLFKSPEEMKKIIDLGPEGHRLIMQLKYKGRTEFLRTYGTGTAFPAGDPWPIEMNTAAALKRLVHPESIPRILYSTGHYERSIFKDGEREYWYTTLNKTRNETLINNGFEFDTISLATRNIPENITALVLADPRSALTENEQKKISDYISKGGNMIIMGEPGKQEILNPLLSQLGVQLMDGTVVEPSFHEMPQMVKALYTPAIANVGYEPLMQMISRKFNSKYPYDTIKLTMPGVAAIAFTNKNDFEKKASLLTNKNSTWIRKGELVTDSAAILFQPENGDTRGSFPTGVQLSRQVGKKEQHIMIMGDADYISNYRLADYFNNTVHYWISNGAYPVYLPWRNPTDNKVMVTGRTMIRLSFVYTWVLPAIILVLAAVLLIRRKRK